MNDYRIRMAEMRSDDAGNFSDWVSSNEDNLLCWYAEGLDFEDLPEQVKAEINTDDVDVWQMMLESHTSKLTFADVPDAYIEMQYELYLQGDEE